MNSILGFATVLFFVAITAALSIIDIKTKLLPNRIILPGILTIHLLLVATVFVEDLEIQKLIETFLGTVIMFSTFLVLALLAKGQLGGGDVKFAALLGPMLGYWGGAEVVLLAIVTIAIIGGIVALAIIVSGKNKGREIAFGPIMTVGSWIALVAGVNWG